MQTLHSRFTADLKILTEATLAWLLTSFALHPFLFGQNHPFAAQDQCGPNGFSSSPRWTRHTGGPVGPRVSQTDVEYWDRSGEKQVFCLLFLKLLTLKEKVDPSKPLLAVEYPL